MVQTYYARVKVRGTTTLRCIQVKASSRDEAKRLIEGTINIEILGTDQ